MFRNLFKPTIAAAALAVAACGGTEEKPIRDTNLRELGSFELEFNPDGTATIRSGVYNQLVFAADGNPLTNPPGTIQAITTSALLGPTEGCAAGLNCFTVQVTNFTGQPQGGVFMGIDSISGVGLRELQDPDPVPTGVSAGLGVGRNFGNLLPGGSATANMDFSIPDNSRYVVRGRYWGDDGSVVKSYSGPTITVNNNPTQFGTILPVLNFQASEFPEAARIQDVNVSITWFKVAGADCSVGPEAPGDARQHETGFRLISPQNTRVWLVRNTPVPTTYVGATPVPPVTVVFDQAAAAMPTRDLPVSGTFLPVGNPNATPNPNLSDLNGQLPAANGGNWRIGASSANNLFSSVCVQSYSISIIAN